MFMTFVCLKLKTCLISVHYFSTFNSSTFNNLTFFVAANIDDNKCNNDNKQHKNSKLLPDIQIHPHLKNLTFDLKALQHTNTNNDIKKMKMDLIIFLMLNKYVQQI